MSSTEAYLSNRDKDLPGSADNPVAAPTLAGDLEDTTHVLLGVVERFGVLLERVEGPRPEDGSTVDDGGPEGLIGVAHVLRVRAQQASRQIERLDARLGEITPF